MLALSLIHTIQADSIHSIEVLFLFFANVDSLFLSISPQDPHSSSSYPTPFGTCMGD